MGPNVSVMNKSMDEMIYEMNHILNYGYVEALNLLRLLYAIPKIAFITTRIVPSLDFISAVQFMIHFIYHFVH